MTNPRPAPAARVCSAAALLLAAPALFAQGETLAPGEPAAGEPAAGFRVRAFADAAGSHRYGLFVPNSPPPPGGYPVVLFLHGAGERGTDGVAPTTAGLGPVVKADPDFPAVVVFPQVEDADGRILTAWHPDEPDGKRALAILAEVEAALPCDPARRVLAGWSMGGYGVAAQLAHGPADGGGPGGKWAAAVLVAGGLTDRVDRERLAAATKTTPLWVVAGAKDRFVPFRETAALVAAVRAGGGRALFTKVPDAGHDVWRTAFAADRFAALLTDPAAVQGTDLGHGPVAERLAARPSSRGFQLPDRDETDRDPAADPGGRFEPALILTRGAFVRADNALLGRLSRQMTAAVPADALSGSIPDQNLTQTVGAAKVRVKIAGIRYAGRLAGASVRGRAGNVLTLRVEIADARLTLGRISFRAPLGHRGTAGPVCLRMAVRRPLPLEIDVRPSVRDGKLALTPLATRFDLPADDYFVAGPCRVEEDGLFLTEAGLARRLVEGLYEARPRIEAAVRDAGPRIVQELEGKLDFGGPGDLAGELLPLPMFEPGVKVRPADLRADAGGLTVLFDLAFGSLPGQKAPPAGPVRADGGVTADAAVGVAGRGEVAVGISLGLMEHLSGALAGGGGLPRIDARDVPGDPLRALTRRDALERILPGLAASPDDEVRARLTLTGPVGAAAADGNPDAAVVDLFTDAVELTIDRRPAGEPRVAPADWEPAARVRLGMRQAVLAAVKKEGEERTLDARPAGRVRIVPLAAAAKGGGAVDAALAARLVAAGWDRWIAGEGPFAGPLKDLTVLGTTLRVEGLTARRTVPGAAGVLVGRFAVPGTTLENRTGSPLEYRVRSAGGGPWGGPFTLAPGATHTYAGGAGLRFRQIAPPPAGAAVAGEARTLEAGAVYAFRPAAGGGGAELSR